MEPGTQTEKRKSGEPAIQDPTAVNSHPHIGQDVSDEETNGQANDRKIDGMMPEIVFGYAKNQYIAQDERGKKPRNIADEGNLEKKQPEDIPSRKRLPQIVKDGIGGQDGMKQQIQALAEQKQFPDMGEFIREPLPYHTGVAVVHKITGHHEKEGNRKLSGTAKGVSNPSGETAVDRNHKKASDSLYSIQTRVVLADKLRHMKPPFETFLVLIIDEFRPRYNTRGGEVLCLSL